MLTSTTSVSAVAVPGPAGPIVAMTGLPLPPTVLGLLRRRAAA